MNYLKLELSDATYQHLKKNFKGDEKAMCAFVTKALNNALQKLSTDRSEVGSEKKINRFKKLLKIKKIRFAVIWNQRPGLVIIF